MNVEDSIAKIKQHRLGNPNFTRKALTPNKQWDNDTFLEYTATTAIESRFLLKEDFPNSINLGLQLNQYFDNMRLQHSIDANERIAVMSITPDNDIVLPPQPFVGGLGTGQTANHDLLNYVLAGQFKPFIHIHSHATEAAYRITESVGVPTFSVEDTYFWRTNRLYKGYILVDDHSTQMALPSVETIKLINTQDEPTREEYSDRWYKCLEFKIRDLDDPSTGSTNQSLEELDQDYWQMILTIADELNYVLYVGLPNQILNKLN